MHRRAEIDLTFELDLWGRLRRATEAARADLLASVENQRTVLTTRDVRLVHRVVSAFRGTGRLLLLSASVWADSGDVLRALRSRRYCIEGAHSLTNDVLIALSARSIGAVVVTQDQRDFGVIEAVRPLMLQPVPA